MKSRTGLNMASLIVLLAVSWTADQGLLARVAHGGSLKAALDSLRHQPAKLDAAIENFRYRALFQPAPAPRAREAKHQALMFVDPGEILFWKFIPKSRGDFMGRSFEVNSDGMRDREHREPKPANTVRIAVIGPSAAVGYGVALEQGFPKQLESRLNERNPGNGCRYEVLNFAVPGYTTLMSLEQYDRKAAKYRPDIILLCLTTDAVQADMTRFGDSHRWGNSLLGRFWTRSAGYCSIPYLERLMRTVGEAGIRSIPSLWRGLEDREIHEGSLRLSKHLFWKFREQVAASKSRGIIVYLPSMIEGADNDPLRLGLAEAARKMAVPFWDLSTPFRSQAGRFKLAEGDIHFNAAGHRLIGGGLYKNLVESAAIAGTCL